MGNYYRKNNNTHHGYTDVDLLRRSLTASKNVKSERGFESPISGQYGARANSRAIAGVDPYYVFAGPTQ